MDKNPKGDGLYFISINPSCVENIFFKDYDFKDSNLRTVCFVF